MSLKATLKNIIGKYNGKSLTYDEFEILCKREGQRTETGMRRMRKIVEEGKEKGKEKEEVDVLTSKKGAITGWFLKRPKYESQGSLF